jgi:hypothetical protein
METMSENTENINYRNNEPFEFIPEEHFFKDLDIAEKKIKEALSELYSKYPYDSFSFQTVTCKYTNKSYYSYFSPIIMNEPVKLYPNLNGNFFK